jgi:putative MFS transporter
MFGIAGLGAMAVWAARKGLPESPRWLESVGRTAEAQRELEAIEASVRKEHGTLLPVVRTDHPRSKPMPLSALFASRVLPRTILGALTAASTLVAIFSFVSWLPTFMLKEGFPVATSLGFSTVMSVGAPLGGLVGFFIADRTCRKQSIVLTGIAIVVLGTIYPLLWHNAAVVIVGLALVTAIYTFVALGIYTYVPELFPTSIRLRGTGFCSMCGRAASIVSPFGVVLVYRSAGLTGVLMIVCGLLILLICAMLAVGVETMSSSLENISEIG